MGCYSEEQINEQMKPPKVQKLKTVIKKEITNFKVDPGYFAKGKSCKQTSCTIIKNTRGMVYKNSLFLAI